MSPHFITKYPFYFIFNDSTDIFSSKRYYKKNTYIFFFVLEVLLKIHTFKSVLLYARHIFFIDIHIWTPV